MISTIQAIMAGTIAKLVAAWSRTASKLPQVVGYAEIRGHLRIGKPPRRRAGRD